MVHDDSLNKTTSTFDGVDLVNYTYEIKDNKVLINTVVRSINKLDGTNIKLMENSLEKQIQDLTDQHGHSSTELSVISLHKPVKPRQHPIISLKVPMPEIKALQILR